MESYEIAEGLAWTWPNGSVLRLAQEKELIYHRATVSAGKIFLGLEVAIPNYQCVPLRPRWGGYVRGIWHRSDRICWIPFLTLSEVARTNSSEAEGYDLMLRLRPAEVVESQLLLGGSGKMGEAMTWLTAQRTWYFSTS